jgi:hypothetical protein
VLFWRGVNALFEGNTVLLVVLALGLVGGVVLLLGQRHKLRFARVIGFSLLVGCFSFAFFVTRQAEAPKWLSSAQLWLSPSPAIKAAAGRDAVAAGTMSDQEFTTWIASAPISWHTSESALYQALQLIESDGLPNRYYKPLTEWLVSSFPAWLPGPSNIERLAPSVLLRLPTDDAARSALIDLMLSVCEDSNAKPPHGWAEALEVQALLGHMNDKQVGRMLVAMSGVGAAKHGGAGTLLPSQIVEIVAPVPRSPSGAPHLTFLFPTSELTISAPEATVLRAAAPPSSSFDLQARSAGRLGWLRVPDVPGTYALKSEWRVTARREAILSQLEANFDRWPVGLRPEDVHDLSGSVVFTQTYTVAGDRGRGPTLVSDPATCTEVAGLAPAPGSDFGAVYRPFSGPGVQAYIHVRGDPVLGVYIGDPPLNLALDVLLEVEGVRTPMGFLLARTDAADEIRSVVPRHDWRTQTAYLVLRPNTDAVAGSPGLARVYAGPEIRFELSVFDEGGY